MNAEIRARAVLAAVWVLCGCEAPVVTPVPAVSVTADVRQCPLITELSVLPLEVILGGEIEVSASASDETFESVWSAGAGSFEDEAAGSTVYSLRRAGQPHDPLHDQRSAVHGPRGGRGDVQLQPILRRRDHRLGRGLRRRQCHAQ